ncbi:MAG: hypothetical protein O3B01_27595 [Planctomycetota bacterium]|nr:hypothetical protein [Planctomycetota bacterium]MDA1142344.1 hypothetical protein [Planctomycetota bacterium]
MKNIHIALLAPCLAALMLAGCGQSDPGNAAEKAETVKKDPGSGKVTKAAFDKMIDDWLKRNEAKMGAELPVKQFRSSLQKWFEENKDKLSNDKFTQKEFDAMIRQQLQGHGHEH